MAIANKAGSIVYRFGNTSVKYLDPDGPVDEEEQPKPTEQKPTGKWSGKAAIANWCNKNQVPSEQFANLRAALIAGGIVKDIPSEKLEPVDFDNLIHAIESNYGEYLRKPA